MHQGKNIKLIRKIKGMTMQDLATKMSKNPATGKKVTTSAISQFESSEFLREKTLEKISRALGVSVDVITKIDFNEIEALGLEDVCNNIFTTYPFHPYEPYNNNKQYEELSKRISEAKADALIRAYSIEARNNDEQGNLFSVCSSIFYSLNVKGQQEAVKRISELAQLEQYKKED